MPQKKKKIKAGSVLFIITFSRARKLFLLQAMWVSIERVVGTCYY
jgi:hypothetical protein